ncbi:MAG TPA: plastocyanin/azurin family copper-binding protein [Bradyrhizobium sp.]|nr:plastocyanin/azurin family copper-binding protein [Bradyrhizobium sp.]
MRLPSLTLVMLLGLSVGALGANMTITQKGRMFSSESITIKKGETLTFLNDDSVPHNIMSTSPGNDFNLGSQPPGASTDVTFKEAGDVAVICAIHPRMKMTVKVTE